MNRVVFLNIETTGLDVNSHEVIRICALITIDKKIKEKVNFCFKPTNPEQLTEDILKINGQSKEKILTEYNDDPRESLRILDTLLKKHGNLEDWILMTHSSSFCKAFFEEWWKKNQSPAARTFNKVFKYTNLDLMSIALYNNLLKLCIFEDFKLDTIKNRFALKDNENTKSKCGANLMTLYNCYLEFVKINNN